MGKPMIGYLRKGTDGMVGERGLAYDYILGQNGIFLEAENPLVKARIRLAEAQVRGLGLLFERVELTNGLVPSYFLAMVLQAMKKDIHREVYAAITVRDGEYHLEWPHQEQGPARVSYQPVANTVLDFHSHGTMPAHFSHTDDLDDQGFRISVVVGSLNERNAQMGMRLGVYGYHTRVTYPEVFTGPLPTGLEMVN